MRVQERSSVRVRLKQLRHDTHPSVGISVGLLALRPSVRVCPPSHRTDRRTDADGRTDGLGRHHKFRRERRASERCLEAGKEGRKEEENNEHRPSVAKGERGRRLETRAREREMSSEMMICGLPACPPGRSAACLPFPAMTWRLDESAINRSFPS